MKVIIGNAWPYANGSLHIGRLCSWLPGDVLARYHRANGDEVVFVSGSDCHGAPVVTKAKELGKDPKELSNFYHREFIRCFNKLGFSFDIFTRTDTESHREGVHKFITELYKNGYIYEKEVQQYYCEHCSDILEYEALNGDECRACGRKATERTANHLFLKLSKFEDDIAKLISKEHRWRDNALKLTQKYLDGGLRDRIVTREIDWGVDVPISGFEDKKIYVWIEALMAYLTASMKCIEERGEDFKEYWNTEDSRVYLLHGKENIPFHTIIFPALLFGMEINKCNIRILSSQYLNLEGKTFSTNRNWAIWVPYIIERFNPDTIRYYLIRRGPETQNADFTWRDFVNIHNNELLGELGNFVNRSLVFVQKYFNGELKECILDSSWNEILDKSYLSIGEKFEHGNFKSALEEILGLIKKGNELFDSEKPWILINEDKEKCKNVIYTCVQIVATLSNLLNPIIPFTCEKIREFLSIGKCDWTFEEKVDIRVRNVEFLFDRIDRKVAIDELRKLKMRKI